MLATRALFLTITTIVWGLNGWALLQLADVVPRGPDAVVGALVVNLILVPLIMWGSYRTGELAEEAFRANKAAEFAAASTTVPKPTGPASAAKSAPATTSAAAVSSAALSDPETGIDPGRPLPKDA